MMFSVMAVVTVPMLFRISMMVNMVVEELVISGLRSDCTKVLSSVTNVGIVSWSKF